MTTADHPRAPGDPGDPAVGRPDELPDDAPTILLLSGPNLNLLGDREPAIYGTATLDDHVEASRAAAAGHGLRLEHLQSNHEGVLVDAIHGGRRRVAGIIINAGAFTHYAWALHDALAAFDGPIVELHLSNPNAREGWRHHSVIAPVATGTIAGFGGRGYPLAVDALAALVDPAPPGPPAPRPPGPLGERPSPAEGPA